MVNTLDGDSFLSYFNKLSFIKNYSNFMMSENFGAKKMNYKNASSFIKKINEEDNETTWFIYKITYSNNSTINDKKNNVEINKRLLPFQTKKTKLFKEKETLDKVLSDKNKKFKIEKNKILDNLGFDTHDLIDKSNMQMYLNELKDNKKAFDLKVEIDNIYKRFVEIDNEIRDLSKKIKDEYQSIEQTEKKIDEKDLDKLKNVLEKAYTHHGYKLDVLYNELKKLNKNSLDCLDFIYVGFNNKGKDEFSKYISKYGGSLD